MTQNPSPKENIEQLRELTLRLLAPPFDSEAQAPQLLAGQLPSALPFDLPLPQGSQIVGSFVRNTEKTQILFDTDLTPDEIVAFYVAQLQGWSEPDFQRDQRHEGGFVHSNARSTLYKTLCKGRHGPALGISTFRDPDKGKKTEVRLHLDTSRRYSPCRQSSLVFNEVGAYIPSLEAPEGGRQHNRGGGGSDSESASTSATLHLESDIALELLVAHYAHQLEQASWQRTGEGSSGPMGWHTWEFYDKEKERWLGVFSLLQVPGMERTYYMQVNINWVGNEGE